MKILAPLFALFVLSGCAMTVDKIDVPYQGAANITIVEGAENVPITVTHEDKRTVYKDRVGTKKNGYGMEMAEIVATNDIAQTVADGVAFELANEGFKIGDEGKNINVKLMRLYNDFKMGFWSGSAVADGLVQVEVREDGKLVFSKSYEGGGVEESIQLASGKNARAALIKAMTDIVTKITQDPQLHSALLKPVPSSEQPLAETENAEKL
ncbi:YajG family lipoprotein [Desulfovibrio sp. Huiquan2017]|uniref:YajG family lipoprotein n=1 Tax=Desulfovibrio sp. Huiquan2017 TaxID=2816861 RepID=UPI001A92434E|nr:YajG family lipoprotein [Desulfovibrio sp. Huiquan2017]